MSVREIIKKSNSLLCHLVKFQDLSNSNSSKFQVSEFILLGFPGIHSWQHWLSLPLALLYLLALGITSLSWSLSIKEATLHQPMYYFLGILAVVDMGLATTIMPKILAILWFNAKAIQFPLVLYRYMLYTVLWPMESGIFVCMAIDRYVAICRPLHYPSIITGSLCGPSNCSWHSRNSLTTIPIPVFTAQRDSTAQRANWALSLLKSWSH